MYVWPSYASPPAYFRGLIGRDEVLESVACPHPSCAICIQGLLEQKLGAESQVCNVCADKSPPPAMHAHADECVRARMPGVCVFGGGGIWGEGGMVVREDLILIP